MGDYDFSHMSRTDLADLRTEQAQVLDVTGAKQRTAVDVDRVATLEAEVLSGFELIAAIDAELERRGT